MTFVILLLNNNF